MFSFAPSLKSVVKTYSYPYVPPQVKPKYLHNNLKLLDDPTIKQIEEKEFKHNFRRISKKELDTQYGIYNGKKGPAAIYNEEGKQYQLGKGAGSAIKLAQLKTREWKALKTVKFEYRDNHGGYHNQKKTYLNECNILFKLGQMEEPEGIIRGNKGNMLTELATGCDLMDWMMERNKKESKDNILHARNWPELIWLEIAIKLANALKSGMHDKNILHRDIKLENFMFDLARSEIVKPIDFGFSKEAEKDKAGNLSFKSEDITGTILYIAPELYRQSDADKPCIYNEATEVYALGILYKHILLNHIIHEEWGRVFESLLADKGNETTFETDDSLGVVTLLESMTDKDPLKRPRMTEIIEKLEIIRVQYIKKHPDSEAQANEVYARAFEVEEERLKKIYEEVQLGIMTIEQLKQTIRDEKNEDSLIDKIDKMCEQGFDFAKQDKDQIFYLIVATQGKHFLKLLSYLAEKGVDLEVEKHGKTPTMVAVMQGSCDVILKLTEIGVDVNKVGSQSITAASLAQTGLEGARNEEEIVKYNAIFKALYDACYVKTQEEHRKAEKNSLFSKMTFPERLDNNLKKVGLWERFGQKEEILLGDIDTSSFSALWTAPQASTSS